MYGTVDWWFQHSCLLQRICAASIIQQTVIEGDKADSCRPKMEKSFTNNCAPSLEQTSDMRLLLTTCGLFVSSAETTHVSKKTSLCWSTPFILSCTADYFKTRSLLPRGSLTQLWAPCQQHARPHAVDVRAHLAIRRALAAGSSDSAHGDSGSLTVIVKRHPDGSPGVDDQDTRLGGGGRRQHVQRLEGVAARQLSPAWWLQGNPRGEGIGRHIAQIHLRLRQSPGERCQIIIRHVHAADRLRPCESDLCLKNSVVLQRATLKRDIPARLSQRDGFGWRTVLTELSFRLWDSVYYVLETRVTSRVGARP